MGDDQETPMTDQPTPDQPTPDPTVDPETQICELCSSGAGGECHVPGCRYWMRDAPRALWTVDQDGWLISPSSKRGIASWDLEQCIEADLVLMPSDFAALVAAVRDADTVEQVRRERDAAYAVIRDAMAEDGDLYGCPYFLTHMVKGVETETCNRGCHDEPACLTSRWGHIQCPDTPEKVDAIRRAQTTLSPPVSPDTPTPTGQT